ncbi:MAG: type II toxin-antitoxin system HicB family antitoxin [Deltaproteobacteria bacterium]|nr:type II toxin-antitoxin system HicB family antitoxin [Deltaproteobacteria bacterium]
MGNEISVSVVIVEKDDGTYKSTCPDLGIDAQGASADDALSNLKDSILEHIRAVGADNLQLSSVKCMKIKIPVD